MSVGLPGSGIGGLFYVVAALSMPLRQCYAAMRGDGQRGSWSLVLRQTAIALGVLAGIWVAGWALGELLGRLSAVAVVAGPSPGPGHRTGSVLKLASLLLASITLVAVLGLVELASALQRRRRPTGGRSSPAGEEVAPAGRAASPAA